MAALLSSLPARVRSLILPWNVNLVCAMVLLGSAAGTALYTVVTSPVFRDRTGIDVTTIGLAVAAGSTATLLALPLWGAAVDRFGRKPVLLLGALASPPLAFWLLVLATGPELVLRSFLSGLLGAGTVVAVPALIADSAPLHQRAQAMSMWGVVFAVGSGAGALGIAPLLDLLGFERLVLLVALLSLVPVGLALALREVSRASLAQGGFLRPLREVARDPRARTLFLVTLSVVFPVIGIGVAILPFLQDPVPKGLGLPLSQIARALLPAGIVGVLVFLPAAWKTDRTLRRRPYILAGAVMAGIPWLLFPWIRDALDFALLTTVIAAGAALAGPAIGGLLTDIMPPEQRGSGFGLFFFAISIAVIIGAPLGGFLYDRFGFAIAFYALALAAVPGEVVALRHRDLLMPT